MNHAMEQILGNLTKMKKDKLKKQKGLKPHQGKAAKTRFVRSSLDFGDGFS